MITQVNEALALLRQKATLHDLDNLATLALALWETGWYEARMLASMVDVPAEVTPGLSLRATR